MAAILLRPFQRVAALASQRSVFFFAQDAPSALPFASPASLRKRISGRALGVSMMSKPTVETFFISTNNKGGSPNNDHIPLLVYRSAFPVGGDTAKACEQMFTENGWTPAWRDTVYPYHHYHATGHELLGIAGGEARICFGGVGGPTVAVRTGDVVVIPAGVSHKREHHSADFLVVGAYPNGVEEPDIVRIDNPADNTQNMIAHSALIARVPVPPSDPVCGRNGPLVHMWAPPEGTSGS
eukprot:m.231778 g.231778  ORF g.231778 m.231778 type:complete len:239 (-) comp18483_c0_seq1:278-994(-)